MRRLRRFSPSFFTSARRRGAWVVVFGLLLATGAAHAQADTAKPAHDVDPKELRELQSFEEMLEVPGVANQHPDLLYRNMAISAWRHGYKERALKMFMRAASYADKPSQAAVANMYWDGEGTAVDRARAYAWMDLAATRGYGRFLAQREYYWSRLTEEERAEALRVGQDIFAEYDDKITLHRLRLELDYVRRNVVGSHVGSVGPGKVIGAMPSGAAGAPSTRGIPSVFGSSKSFDADGPSITTLTELYRPSVWKIDDYAKMKDVQWEVRVESKPTVEIGDLQKASPPASPPDK